jgi:uncharacterized membrane protein
MRKSGLMASMVVFFVVMGAGFAFAQAVAAPVASTPANALGLAGLVKGLLVGSIIGFAVAFLGYMKDKAEDKKWDFKAAAPTLIWGAIVGALTGLGQKDLSSLDGFKDNAATVIIAELVGKAAFRNGAPVIGNVVSALLGRKS